MSSGQEVVVRDASSAPTIGVLGDVCRLLITGAETNGAYALIDTLVPPGGGPPPHIHTRESEAFLVLSGVMTFLNGQQQITAGPGTFVQIPPGTRHTFHNGTADTVRVLIHVAPAGLEEMFLAGGVKLPEGCTVCPPPTPEDVERILTLCPQYGVEIELPG